MKLLFDQNLSPRLVPALAALYPGSVHVRNVGLQAASDEAVWDYALQHGLVIVSKDADFHQRLFVAGPPPKAIWIQRGNCTTREIETLLRRHASDVRAFVQDETSAFLALG